MPPLNYQIGIEVVNKAERTLKQLDKSVKQKFKAMVGYQKKFNIQTQLSQQLSRRLLETETMGLSKMQKFYGPVLKNKKGMTKLSDAWHKSESKNLREVNSLMGLNKTEQVKYLKRVGASTEEMKRDTTFTKMNTKSKTELSKIESCRGRGLREIGNTVSKTMKMEKEGLVTLSSAQKKQYNDMQRITEGYKTQHTAVGKLKNSMGKLFGTIKKAGMIFLTVLGPLFLVGAAMRTLKSAADWVYQPFIKFEDAMYELRKTANLTKDAMLEIGEAISELSLRIPVAAEELAKIAATAGRLGIRGRENILAFTETIAKMSVATVLTADEAAEALARIRQAFAIPVENIEYLGSVINELSNTTASNSRDIVAALGNIGAAGKMLNITADQASAMSATLISSGMAATRAGCVDEKTEILTKDGWKGIDEMSEQDLIATRNPKGEVEYKKPKLIFKRKWNDKMIHFKTKTSDILVTPDHRMLIKKRRGKEYIKTEAQNCIDLSQFCIPATASWKGKKIKKYQLNDTFQLFNKTFKKIYSQKKVSMKDWCFFMGCFLSEGCIVSNKRDAGTIKIGQIHNSFRQEIIEIIQKLGFQITYSDDYNIEISNKQLFNALRIYVGIKSYSKWIPQYIKDLSPEYLEIFLDAYIKGDGNQNGNRKIIFTSSKKMRDDLAEIGLKCGYRISDSKIAKAGRIIDIKNKKYISKHDCFAVRFSKVSDNHHFRNSEISQVQTEDYNGRIWCPILPPYETIFIKRNGKTAWTYQTRIRRMLTEMARKSEKMAETMEISAEEMKFAIEENPMEALLMYLKHLSETESKVDKLKEAHEIFGKVGGFAIATLAESYPELIKNLETAREETKWGTSLQREFQIATTKTSAELQILANRAEAARREIGENFIPTLISAKKIGVAFTESLNVMSKVWAGMRGETEKAIVPLSLYEEEWKRLANIAQDPAIEDIARTTKEWKTGFWVSRKELRTLVEEMEKLEPSTEAYNKQLSINAIIQNQNNVAMRTGYEIAKKYGDLESENLKPLGNYNDYLDIRNRIQKNITASTDETIDKETEFAKLNKIENQLFKDSAKVLVPYLEKKKELELITAEESIQLENLKIYLRTVGKETEVVENATEKLNKMSETYVDTIIEEVVEIKFLTDETKDLVDVTKSLWDEVDTLTNVYSNALEAQYDYQEMEKRMPSVVKNVLSPMQSQIDLAKDLMKAGKDDAAALQLATVANQLYAQGLTETNKRRQAAYMDAYKYIDSMTEAISGAPAEVAAAKVGFGKLFEPEPLMVDADFSLFKEKFKTEIEEAYFDKEYRILIKPEITEPVVTREEEGFQYGGRVPRTGYFKLHEGEEVLTKSQVDSHNEDNSFHLSMNGVTLSDGYNAQKLLKDIEEYSLSRL